MIFVKFIVMFGCISILSALQTNYCQICSNHTLCLYKIPGPSSLCKLYDTAALLSSQEIEEIIHKINERRNFIATGGSAKFPQASNMKKIYWSPELASFAQRWADQCDPFLNPDRQDDCRDLENAKVGQNIGSVIGTSPGLNVKGFIEMWFMQILDYAGSVTYYNQSQNQNTGNFTQMIWAETELIGCGKVKFYVDEKQVMLERLVCNFAPRGNIQAKSLYKIGYAGTQCPKNMIPDREYKGLCDYENSNALRKSTFQRPSVSSQQKIVKLSNNTGRQGIDLKHNTFKAVNYIRDKQKNKKTRHILSNNSHSTIRRTSLHDQNMRTSPMPRNMRHNEYLYQHKQGHSRLYHGNEPARHEASRGPIYSPKYYFQVNKNRDLRRCDFTTAPVYLIFSPTYRQHNKCSRQRIQNQFGCYSHQCTRGRDECCHQRTGCQGATFTNPTLPETLCSQNRICCSKCPPTCPPYLTTIDNCNHSCQCTYNQCTKYDFGSIHLSNMLRSGNHKATQKKYSTKDNSKQYDLKLSETHKTIHEKQDADQSNEKQKENTIHTEYKDHYFFYPTETKIRKKRQFEHEITLKPFRKINDINNKIPETKALRYTTLPNRNHFKKHRLISTETITIKTEDYSSEDNDEKDNDEELTTEKYLSFNELMYLRKLNHNYLDYNARRQGKTSDATKKKKDKDKKKDTDKKKDKDKDKKKDKDKDKKKDKDKDKKKDKDTTKGDSTTVKPTKAKTKKTVKPTKAETKTTVKPTKAETKTTVKPTKTNTKSTVNPTKAKKAKTTKQTTTQSTQDTANNDDDDNNDNDDGGEYYDDDTTITTTTPEYTANTQFIRQKQCTRKLTCTWTAFTVIAADGNQIRPMIDIGSRTPPGYVEGCTRTSTCTRDFLERNIMLSTLPNNSGKQYEGITGEATGEKGDDGDDYCEKRNLKVRRQNSDYKDATTTSLTHEVYKKQINSSVTVNPSKIHHYMCNKKTRQKRQGSASSISDSKVISYADLYYLVLNKIIKTYQAKSQDTNRCLCNCTTHHTNILFYMFCFIFHKIV